MLIRIIPAVAYRNDSIELLSSEELPVADLPTSLENFLVAVEKDRIIGVIGLEIYSEYGLLRSLAVSKEWRSKGVADALLKQLETNATLKGLKQICLLTETAADYFKRKNYQIITRDEVPEELRQSSEFSHVCPQSAIVMSKTLIIK